MRPFWCLVLVGMAGVGCGRGVADGRFTLAVTGAAPAPVSAAAPGSAAAAPAPGGNTAVGNPSPAPSDAVAKEAAEIYAGRCVTCHGAAGGGDGPAGVALPTKPRNFQDKAWQSATSDEAIEKVIREGGPAVGKSPLMPPQPDLAAKPQVLSALRAHIRAFAK